MAAVNSPPTTRDRAQLILVGGLALAVTIVVLALVLNSAIYSHNLASRSDSAASEAMKFGEDTRRGVGGLLDAVNEEESGTDFSGLESDYGTALESWESSTRNWTGSNGRAVSVTSVSQREGVRIVDDDGSTFQPATGPKNPWTVAKEVRVRKFEMKVDGGDMLSASTAFVESGLVASGAFTVVFDDGTDQWEVTIYEDDDTLSTDDVSITVHRDGTSTYETCTVGESEVVVDFTDADLGTEECAPLEFLSEYDGPYDVTFHNPGASDGSYELTVDRVIDGTASEAGTFTDAVDTANFGDHCSGPTYNGPSGPSPFVAPAIYSAEVGAEFVGSDTISRSQYRVAPDEPGGQPDAPRVTEFTVDEGTASDGSFTVDWAVEDPNGDLDEVRVSVEGTTVSESVSGASAGGSTTVAGGGGPNYTIEVTVEDTDTNTRTTTREHVDDGSVGVCPA